MIKSVYFSISKFTTVMGKLRIVDSRNKQVIRLFGVSEHVKEATKFRDTDQ